MDHWIVAKKRQYVRLDDTIKQNCSERLIKKQFCF